MITKDEIKEQAKNAIRSSVKTRKRWLSESKKSWNYLNKYVDFLPEFGDMPVEFRDMEDATIRFQCPYNKILRHDLVELMKLSGWYVSWEKKEQDCNSTWDFPVTQFTHSSDKEDGFRVNFFFNEKISGSTCQRKQIGTQQKEVPVYEWACEDMEMTGPTEYNG